jgi:hypothetical protein
MSSESLSKGEIDLPDNTQADPFFRWADASRFSEFIVRETGDIKTGRVDVLIELKNPKTFADLKNYLGGSALLVEAYRKITKFRYLSASLTLEELKKLSTASNPVSRVALAAPLTAPRIPERLPKDWKIGPSAPDKKDPYPDGWAPKKKILLAAIDDGCPFAHQLLRSGNRLRLRALWDQDQHPDFSQIGQRPPNFGYGAVAHRGDLDAHISANTLAGAIDEAQCYRSLGYMSAVRERSHGAHSIGMILQGARYDPDDGVYPKSDDGANQYSDLVFVQLPRDVIAIPSTGARYRAILDGILWVTEQANADEDVVVNVPYGSLLGPHDGTSIFVQALDELVKAFQDKSKRTLQVVFSVGNSFKSQQHWVVKRIEPRSFAKATLRIAAGSETPTFAEVWLPTGADANLELTNATGETVFSNIGSSSSKVWPSNQSPQCTILRTGWGSPSECVLLRFAPTAPTSGGVTTMCGDWTLKILSNKGVTEPIHAYLSTARGGLGSLHRANQSHFILLEGDSADFGNVEETGTLQDAVTGKETIAIGAYKRRKFKEVNAAAEYTSSGPARGGYRKNKGPDDSMSAEASPLLHGFRNMGNRSGSTFRMNGTSVAAAYRTARLGNPTIAYPSEPVPKNEGLKLGEKKVSHIGIGG